MSRASACGAQDHQALSHHLRAGVHDQDIHPVGQARRLAAHVPSEAVQREGGEVPYPQPGEVVERDRARNRVVAEDHTATAYGILRHENRFAREQRRRAEAARHRRRNDRLGAACRRGPRAEHRAHAQAQRVSLAQVIVQLDREQVGEPAPRRQIRAQAREARRGAAGERRGHRDERGPRRDGAASRRIAVQVELGHEVAQRVIAYSGDLDRVELHALVGPRRYDELERGVRPDAHPLAGGRGVLVPEYTENTPLPGAESSGFCRDGRLSRTGRVGPEDENVARSPTCSRTTNWKRPPCAVQLTRFTWAATVMARAALPGEPTRYPLSPPLEICELLRLLLVPYSHRSNRPEPARLSSRSVITQLPAAGGCAGFPSYISISPCRSPFCAAGPNAAL